MPIAVFWLVTAVERVFAEFECGWNACAVSGAMEVGIMTSTIEYEVTGVGSFAWFCWRTVWETNTDWIL